MTHTNHRTAHSSGSRLLLVALLMLMPLALILSNVVSGAEATTEPEMATSTKEAPPAPGEPKGFKLPSPHTFELDNGLRATLVQYGLLPKATVVAQIRTGNNNETAEEVWLADLTGNLMGEGSTTRDAKTLASEAAAMGGDLNPAPSAPTSSPSSHRKRCAWWPMCCAIQPSPRANSRG